MCLITIWGETTPIMRMGLREVIGLCCLITGIAGRVVRNEDVQNKILGNQNNYPFFQGSI